MVVNLKHVGYFGFLVSLPLQDWRPAIACYLVAHFASILHMFLTIKNGKEFLPKIFSEEELLTLFPLFGLLIAGPYVRVLLYAQIIIWTIASTCEWISNILERSPNFPILCGLTPVIDLYKGNWLDFLKFKNHIEVFTMFVSCFGWVFSLNAPLLPVVYTQFVRIKCISSYFT